MVHNDDRDARLVGRLQRRDNAEIIDRTDDDVVHVERDEIVDYVQLLLHIGLGSRGAGRELDGHTLVLHLFLEGHGELAEVIQGVIDGRREADLQWLIGSHGTGTHCQRKSQGNPGQVILHFNSSHCFGHPNS